MPATDLTSGNERRLMLPGTPFLITPSDVTDCLYVGRTLTVGSDGAVSVVRALDGATVVIPYVAAGIPYPILYTRVNATGTTASNIWGIG